MKINLQNYTEEDPDFIVTTKAQLTTELALP